MPRRAQVRAVIGAALAGCLLLGGCQSSFRFDLGGPSDQEMLERVSLTEDDAAEGAVFEPYEGGDEVVGRTSLDLCDGEFPSEDLRVGRRQVGIGDSTGASWVSSEAILYRTPEEAEQAMAELDRARESCPEDAVEPQEGDREPLTWAFEDPPDGDWPQEPGVTRQSYAFTVTTPDGSAIESSASYLQRGRMILALYSTPPDGPAAAIRNAPSPARFVEVLGNRLAALPEESVQEPNPESTVPTGSGEDGFDT